MKRKRLLRSHRRMVSKDRTLTVIFTVPPTGFKIRMADPSFLFLEPRRPARPRRVSGYFCRAVYDITTSYASITRPTLDKRIPAH